ncbi:MAG: serine hydrolase [Saprospiraceae bacterium]|nr:serine hydrolase [Saprospiraceae bacterium]MBK7524495.1 serine hydrolase [Saprospiraceae bacterium]MBK8371143.1 serine hydrolase [Saprospiraceae bacterium]MBK8818153.1 serine hydrolase [Saprospiraceae bacterium]MBK8854100.1 serine hydrolase [Saprospiraceae bacterium]
MMRKIFIALAGLILIILATFYYYLFPRLTIVNGFAAKIACSCKYIEGRDITEIKKNVLYHSLLPYTSLEINEDKFSVRATFFGLKPKTAVYKKGVGCILLKEGDSSSFQFTQNKSRFAEDSIPVFTWKEGITAGTRKEQLDQVVMAAFDEDFYLTDKRTSAVLVIHNDTIVAEKYAKPFNVSSPQLGWSMAKSLLNTFIGLMVYNDKIDLSQQNLFSEWKNDERSKISLNDLLQMSSGLEWEEDYTKICDVTTMLYDSEKIAEIPLSKQLVGKPGKIWLYSSGTSNLISCFIRNSFANDEAYFSYLNRKLFDRLGMSSMLQETDATGTFIGSSYVYGLPRDWAKFGLLYLHNGTWMGKQILPDYWVNYTTSPAIHSKNQYGAHFWLNKEHSFYKDAPEDMFYADGYQGQYVFIIPSRDLVVVRMGTGDKNFDVNSFLKGILENVGK